MAEPFYERVKQLLLADPTMRELGFGKHPEDIAWYGKGADYGDLMQVARDPKFEGGWMVPAKDAEPLGYTGVWVHFESERRGHWCLHCEFYPRRGKREKTAIERFEEMRQLKAEIVTQLRVIGEKRGWDQRLGASTKRARKDPSHPSANLVLRFDLGMDESVEPEEFVRRIVPVIHEVTPEIDRILVPAADGGGKGAEKAGAAKAGCLGAILMAIVTP